MIRDLVRSRWTRGAITALLLVQIFRTIDVAGSFAAMAQVPMASILFVLALVAVDRLIMITRWVLLLNSSRIQISFRSASSIYLVSSFVGGSISPGVGADVARAWTLGHRTSHSAEATASVALDRMLGLLALVLLGAFGIAVWTYQTGADLWLATVALAVLVSASSGAFLWSDAITRTVIPAAWLTTRTGGAFLRLVTAVGRYRERRSTLAAVLGLSIVVQWLRIAQAWLLGSALGIDVSFGYYLVFMPIGLLLLLLPISIGGFGLPQQGFLLMLHPQGVADETSFALSTLVILTGLVGNLPGAALYLKSRARY